MSNKNVDERIVQMKFDNQSFEKGAQQTMSTLDKLKQKLNFRGAVQGLDELGSAVDNIGMDGLAQSVGVVTAKFSAFEVMAITAISNITNKVMNLGERMLKSLSVDQLSSGWAKYEDKITSVQTIMAATASTWEENARKIGFAGTQMEFVNEQLDKLNWFSDETSFSFTDMTSNIGKFTSAGIELDKAVTAMEGISVWAAKSGQNAQSASRAYYNLAQAISVGAVKLIDWKSIENANMATIEFKQTAIDTALAMGTLKKKSKDTFETLKGEEVTVRNFNEGLKDGWFTSEVLMKTLDEYGKAATRLSEISDEYGVTATEFLNGMEDYNEGNANINDIAKELELSAETLIPLFKELSGAEYKLSLSAFKAAQEAKTFSEVLAATKDAVSTGWMNTFELIFGNYEETKKLWSNMAEQFYDIFAGGAEGRNNMIKEVLGDPWEQLSDKIKRAGISSKAFEQQLITTMRNSGVPIDELLEKWGSIEEVFKHVDGIGQYVKQTILSFTEPIQTNVEAITEATAKVEDFQKVVNQVIRGEFKSGKERVKNLTEAGYDYATVQGLVNKVWERNGHTWKDTTITMDDLVDVMGNMTKEELKQVGLTEEQVKAFQALQEEARETGTDLDLLVERLSKPTGRQLIFSSLTNMVEAFRVALETIKNAWAMAFPPKSDSIIYRMIEGFHKFTEWLIMSEETSARVAKALSGVFNVLGIIVDIISAIVKTLFPGVSKGATKVGDIILSFFEKFADATAKVREFLKSSNIIGQAVQLIVKYFHKGIDAIKNFIHKTGELPIVSKNFEKVSDKFKKIFDFFKKTFGEFFESLTQENADLETSLINLFNTIKKKAEEIIGKIPFLKNVKDAFLKVFDAMKTVGEYFSEGFWQGLKKSASFIFGKIVDFITGIKDKIWELFDIHSPSGWAIETVWWIAKGVVEGLIQVTKWLVDKIRSFVKKIMGVSEDLIEGVPGAMSNGVENNMGTVIDSLKKVFSKVTEFLQAFFAWVKDGVVAIVDYIKSIPFDTLYNIIKEIINILYVLAAIKMYFNIGEGMKNIAKAFNTVADAVSGFLKAKRLKTLGKVAISFAIAIAIIAGALIALSRLSGENLKGASEVLLSAMIILGMIMAVLFALDDISAWIARTNKKKGIIGGKSSALGNMALLLLSIAASMVLIMIAVTQLVNLMNGSKKDQLTKAVNNIVILFGIFMAVIEVLNVINSKVLGKNNGALKSIGTILAVVIAINLILKTINKYFFTKDETGNLQFNQKYAESLLKPLLYMGALIVAIGGVIALITGAAGKWGIKGAGAAILSVAIALIIIVEVINNIYERITHMDSAEFVMAIIAFSAVFVVLALLISAITEITKNIKTTNASSAYLALAAFMAAIVAFIGVLGVLIKVIVESQGNLIDKVAVMVIMFAGIIVFVSLLGTFIYALNETFTTEKQVKRVQEILNSLSLMLLAVGALIMLIAGAAWVTSINDRILVSFGAIILAMVIVLAGIVYLINYITKKLKLSQVKEASGLMTVIMIFIGILAAALTVLALVAKDNIGGMIVSGVLLALVAGVMTALLKVLSTVINVKGTVTLLVALALSIGAIAFALYELSKVNADQLSRIATVLGTFIVVIAALLILAAKLIAISPEMIPAMAAIESLITVAAVFVAALALAFKTLKDLIIVLGVWFGGGEFASSVAQAFSTTPIVGFADAVSTAESTIAEKMNNIGEAFSDTDKKVGEFFQDVSKAINDFAEDPEVAVEPAKEFVKGMGKGISDVINAPSRFMDWFAGPNGWIDNVLISEDEASNRVKAVKKAIDDLSTGFVKLTGLYIPSAEETTEKGIAGQQRAYEEAIANGINKSKLSPNKEEVPKEVYDILKAQGKTDEEIKQIIANSEKPSTKDIEIDPEQLKRDQEFLKDRYNEGKGDGVNGLLYSRQIEQQMRENSKALVEGTAEAIGDAGTTIGTAAGETIIEKMVDVSTNGTVGSAFLNGQYAEAYEALTNLNGENGVKIDSEGLFDTVSFFDVGYQDAVTEDLDGLSTVPSDIQGLSSNILGMMDTQNANNEDLLSSINALRESLGGGNDIGLYLDGNLLGQILTPYINSGMAKIFVQSGR